MCFLVLKSEMATPFSVSQRIQTAGYRAFVSAVTRILFCCFILLAYAPLASAQLPYVEITYGRVGKVDLEGDFYAPLVSHDRAPVVIWAHGGGLLGGSRKGDGCTPQQQTSPIIAALVQQGYAVFNIDYRLSRVANPQQPCPTQDPYSVGAVWPAHIQDVRTAIRWVRTNAYALGVNPSSIIIAGESGGGQISSVATLATEEAFEKSGDLTLAASRASSLVRAGLDWYGVSDAVSWYHYIKLIPPALTTPPYDVQGVESVYGGSPVSSPQAAARYRSASAVNYVRSGVPPLFVVHGTCDMVVPFYQSRTLLANAYMNAGLTLALSPIQNANHGFSVSCLGIPSPDKLQQAIDQSLGYLETLLR